VTSDRSDAASACEMDHERLSPTRLFGKSRMREPNEQECAFGNSCSCQAGMAAYVGVESCWRRRWSSDALVFATAVFAPAACACCFVGD